ncbi:MAG: glycosyltransferase, partial [Planctomycetota bacterium]
LVGEVDAICAVSETLVARVGGMLNRRGAENAETSSRDVTHPGVAGSHASRRDVESPRRKVVLLTHGVDPSFWREVEIDVTALPKSVEHVASRLIEHDSLTFVFWGLLDERMDRAWVRGLTKIDSALVVLIGPADADWHAIEQVNVWQAGRTDHERLPQLAAAADVLVMPYRDMPVTRAMQPLKLLEYLATYKPVVVRRLPATEAWADCCDVVETAEEFVRVCRERAEGGLPADQRAARERRLPRESWSEKSRQLEVILREGGV